MRISKHILILLVVTWFLIAALTSASVEAAKTIPVSERPFNYTVEAYADGINKTGKNISWARKEADGYPLTYQGAAFELWAGAPMLYAPNSVVWFLVEWPRYGYDSFWIYGCIAANRTLRIVNRKEDCSTANVY